MASGKKGKKKNINSVEAKIKNHLSFPDKILPNIPRHFIIPRYSKDRLLAVHESHLSKTQCDSCQKKNNESVELVISSLHSINV